MRKLITYTVVMVLGLSIALGPVPALAMQDTDVFVYRSAPSGEAMIGDALIVRPVSLVCLGVSSLFFSSDGRLPRRAEMRTRPSKLF